MKYIYKTTAFLLIILGMSACAGPELRTQEPQGSVLPRPGLSDIQIDVVGMGAISHTFPSPAQDLLMAKRAAIVDGYRQIGERIYGIQVNAKETVKDMAAKNSTVTTCINSVIKNAKIGTVTCKDEVCQAQMEVVLDSYTLREIFPWKD